MTIQQMHDYFDLVQDKFNSPYFVDTEKDIFINQAQERFVNLPHHHIVFSPPSELWLLFRS